MPLLNNFIQIYSVVPVEGTRLIFGELVKIKALVLA